MSGVQGNSSQLDEAFDEETLQLVSEYCAGFGGQLSGLAELLGDAGRLGEQYLETLRELFGEFHRLSGSASCMGFSEVGGHLAEMETLLEGFVEATSKTQTQALRETSLRMRKLAELKAKVVPRHSELLEMPEAPAPEPEKPKSVSPAAVPQELAIENLRVMFADDDQSIRTLMRSILQVLNVEAVETASNGEELMEKIKSFRPNLIITDWQMKPMNGLEVMKAVRNGETYLPSDCPVIFLSSQNSLGKVQEALGEGANYFLIKPFSRKSVEKALLKLPFLKAKTGAKKAA